MSRIFPFSSHELTTWIESPDLSIADRRILNDSRCLTASHISAVHCVLRAQFPTRTGLQDTHYLRILKVWRSDLKEFVQILYVDSVHWVYLSCEDGCVELYDSMTTLPPEDGSIVKQVCTVLKSLKLDVFCDHCICRQPEAFKFMICCDACNLWFHEQCVKQKDVNLDYNDQWLCPSCIYLRKLYSYM